MSFDVENIANCPTYTAVFDYDQEAGSQSFLQTVLHKQLEAAHEEPGDELRYGDEFTDECIASAEMPVSLNHAKNIIASANRCLSRRYMGTCVVNQCRNKDFIDDELRKLQDKPVAIRMKGE